MEVLNMKKDKNKMSMTVVKWELERKGQKKKKTKRNKSDQIIEVGEREEEKITKNYDSDDLNDDDEMEGKNQEKKRKKKIPSKKLYGRSLRMTNKKKDDNDEKNMKRNYKENK